MKTETHLVALPACHRVPRKQRGTVIVLVVAVLALLAVIGTVYIVSARSDKATSSAMNATLNLNLARNAAMNRVIEAVGDAMFDKDGHVGADGSVSPARNWDFPDSGQPWLVGHLHVPSGATVTNEYSRLTDSAFDPSTGTYTRAFPLLLPYSNNLSTVVGDQTTAANDRNTLDDPPTAISDGYMDLLPFSDASGIRYRVSLRILDTNRMANLNTGANDDAAAIADTSGTYITSLRLAPAGTAGSAPTGWPAVNAYYNTSDKATGLQSTLPAGSGLGRAGTSASNITFSLTNWNDQAVLRYEKPLDPALALFDLSDELELRSYGQFGTSYHIRPASTSTSPTNYLMWPFTLSANPASLAAANGTTVIGNPSRRNYTTYSFSREIRPYPDMPAPTGAAATDILYTLTPASPYVPPTNPNPDGYIGGATTTGTAIWPTYPARVSVNLALGNASTGDNSSQTQLDAMFRLAMISTNIASAMRDSTRSTILPLPHDPDFTDEEIAAFVANVCTARWNGFQVDKDPALVSAGALYLPAGPSFVDKNGICIRTADNSTPPNPLLRDFGNNTDVKTSGGEDKIYLGYAAQPFMSEVAAFEHYDLDPDTGAPVVTITDFAVEFYNPYDVALSLKGYQIKFQDAPVALDSLYVPAKGWLVLRQGTHFTGTDTATAIYRQFPGGANAQNIALAPGGGKITLFRGYFPRGATASATPPAFATVDTFDYSNLVADPDGKLTSGNAVLPNGPPDKEFTIQRGYAGPWSATVASAPLRIAGQTLGTQNAAGGSPGVELFDRFAMTTPQTQASPFSNIREFNRIPRLCHEINPGQYGDPATPNGLLQDQATKLTASAPYSTTQFPTDSQMHFDFLGAPWNYASSPPTTGTNPGSVKPGDIRAVRLLEHLAFIDRYADTSINVSNNNRDINKIRLPGQINVNTASGDVLRAIPNMTDQMVANILGYRIRAGASNPACTYNSKTNIDFSGAKYPGLGIRSLSELLVPLSVTTSATIADRDQLWANIYNLCTTRSDTFVVYGYLEALKVNPTYTGTHDNGASWYAGVTDTVSPSNAGIPNLRVARRRWVAIIDRSFCNVNKKHAQFLPDGTTDPKAGQNDSNFSLPKIVAIKDLPQ